MTKPRILVTSAAGHTGSVAVKRLLAQGFPVRALVRRVDSRSRALEKLGADVLVGNLHDYDHLRRAMAGVQRAYHCPPFAPNLLHGNMLFAMAAEEARLEMVAFMEAWNADPRHRSDFTRQHWLSQKIVDWMPSVASVHIAPGLFAFAYFLDVQTIRHLGWLLLPLGEARNAPPSNEDIAAVAAAVVADPRDHIGKFYRPTGPELLSPEDVAGVCQRVLGRPVSYRNVSTRMFTKAATALGLARYEIAQIRHFVEEHRAGAFAQGAPTDHVEQITGRPPEPFEATAKRYLETPALVHRRFGTGSKLGAVTMLLQTALTSAPDLDAFERGLQAPAIQDPVLAHESSDWRAGLDRFQPSQPAGAPVMTTARIA